MGNRGKSCKLVKNAGIYVLPIISSNVRCVKQWQLLSRSFILKILLFIIF